MSEMASRSERVITSGAIALESISCLRKVCTHFRICYSCLIDYRGKVQQNDKSYTSRPLNGSLDKCSLLNKCDVVPPVCSGILEHQLALTRLVKEEKENGEKSCKRGAGR